MTASTRDSTPPSPIADATLGPPKGPPAPGQAAAPAHPNAMLQARLVVVAAPDMDGGLGHRFALGDVARIGTALDNDIVLGIDGVAAHHVRIERRARTYHVIVEDGEARAARTWLGDRPLQGEAALRHGAVLTLGRARLELHEGYTQSALDEAYHDCIYRMTILDGSIGAYNERYLLEALSREMVRALRHRAEMALAIFKIDVTTSIDAAWARDDALRAIVRRLSSTGRRDDIIARLGADELAVLMADTSEAAARECANAMHTAIHEVIATLETGPTALTGSVGFAMFEASDEKAVDLIARVRRQVDAGR
ncbi:FHA domain/GGDEF domain protein [Minicystis rosea]|nr:FHA domain/GGDEF domain protein [Minicystis rosea]